MKAAVLSESLANEATVRILVEGIIGRPTEPVGFSIRQRDWPSVLINLPAVLSYLHYRTDAEALVVVVDSDDSLLHQPAHDMPGGLNSDCRRCRLQEAINHTRSQLAPLPGRDAIKTAVGVAVPAIEAWCLCGNDSCASEAVWSQGGTSMRGRHFRNELKRKLYGAHPSPLSLQSERAIQEARRLAQDITLLESFFPVGFGTLARDVRNW